MKKTATFELTSGMDRSTLEKLTNAQGVTVLNQQDFFGTTFDKDEGASVFITRVVDYRDTRDLPSVADVYTPPFI